MEQLRFTAVHEDGQHLVLSTPDGAELLLPVDARLRAALRSRTAPADAPATPLSPRNVQAMIRAGQNPEEVAEITGWPAERVARFEGPILAEREHVSGMAQAAHVRGRAPEGGIPTLGSRVLERLAERGVDTDNVGWDATRPEGGVWTVVVSFVAGQRQRAAAWHFDHVDRTVEALDDEARWLSEDEQALPGISGGTPRRGAAADKPLLSGRVSSGEVDLMTSMRERSRSRGRRKKASTSASDPAGLPQLEHAPEDVLPLEDLAYDPDTMGLPPAAHGESPAPDAAAEAAPEEGRVQEAPTAAKADPRRGGAPTDYDVPLEFDNDDNDDDPADTDPDVVAQDPHAESTLADDLFGPEGEEDLQDEPDAVDADEALDADEPADSDEAADEAADDVELELGEEVLDEDAVELGGALDDTEADPVDAEATDSAPAGAQDVTTVGDAEPEPVTEGDAEPESVAEGEDEPEPVAEAENEDSAPAADNPAQGKATPTRRKDGRPGVPSWDDIMFGAKDRGR